MATYDPVTTASTLATAYTQNAQSLLDRQTTAAQTTSSALTRLQSALSAFSTALDSLSSKKGVVSNSATFSDTAYGSATATASAAPGTYPLFVEQIASAHQVMFTDLPAVPVPVTGKLNIAVSGASFDVDFSTADLDGDGTLSQTEIARAVNQASDNGGKVSATVVSANGQSQLILTAGETGADSQITVDAAALTAGAGNAAEVAALKAAFASGTQLAAAQDAVIYVGTKSPATRIAQASNTFTAIAGVSMTFTQAMDPADGPVTLTVAGDKSGTAANVQSFIDAYNTLKRSLDEMTRAGNSESGVAAGAFSTDSGIRALRSKLGDLLRQSVDGQRLMDYGVSASRDGTLSLDSAKLEKKLATSPAGLDELFGNTSLSAGSGLLGSFSSYLDRWTDASGGQIKSRQESLQKRQAALTRQQTRLDLQYDNAYQRYLGQFTVLQNLQAQMSSTSSIFENLSVFSTD